MHHWTRYFSTALTVVALLVGSGGPSAGERERQRDDRAGDERPFAKPQARSLEEMIDRVETYTLPGGSTVEYTHLKEPVPYAEFMQALALESGYTPQPPISPTTADELLCIPPDDDYDGDGFTGSDESSGLLRGPYIADLPRVVTEFDNVWPGLEVTLTETGSREDRGTQVTTSGLDYTNTTSELLDFKNHFNSRTQINLNFGVAGLKPSFSLDASNTTVFDVTRNQEYLWKRDITRTLSREITRTITESSSSDYTIANDAGFVKGDVYIANRSDYSVDVDVSEASVLVVALSPYTGHKYTFGFASVRTSEDDTAGTLSGHLDWGLGVQTSRLRGFVEMRGISRTEIEPYLLGGWMFDMEVAGNFGAVVSDTGESVWDVQQNASQRTSRFSISYGPSSGIPRQYVAVSIYDDDGEHCITPRKALERIKANDPGANLEFDWENGRLVLTAMNGLVNRHTDRDFASLTEAEKDEFGRWVVGYQWGPRNEAFGEIDLARTPIGPEDVIYFYYLTRADLEDPLATPDAELPVAVANDGTSPSEQLVDGDVSPGDVLELDLFNTFELHSSTQQSAGQGNAGCDYLYQRTLYDTEVAATSDETTVIPDVDFYGIQLEFAGLGFRDLGDVIADAGENAELTLTGAPEYGIQLRMEVTPAMTGLANHQPLRIRQAQPRQSFLIGYTGRDAWSRFVDCRVWEQRGYRRTSGSLLVFQKLDPDSDGDGVQPTGLQGGLDSNESNAHVFAYAPEHLDGIDNDADGSIDERPVLCPATIRGGETVTCRIDDRLGWYGPSADLFSEYRWLYASGGTTPWISLGSDREFDLFLPLDPAWSGIEVRTTYDDGQAAFSGLTQLTRAVEADPDPFLPETDVEAEDGRLTYPMSIDGLDGTDFVVTPIGTTSGGLAEYPFDVAVGGPHRIEMNVDADDSTSDSFAVEIVDPQGNLVWFAGMGGTAHFQFADAGYAYDGFRTLPVGHTHLIYPTQTLHPVTWNLQPGPHIVRVRTMERGARLDRLRLTRHCPDADGDGWTTCSGDCDDGAAAVHPGQADVCGNGIDDDCDGVADDGCGSCRSCPDIHQQP